MQCSNDTISDSHGREAPSLITYYSNENDPPKISSLLQQRDRVLNKLKQNLLKAQARMKKMANKNRSEVSFNKGHGCLLSSNCIGNILWRCARVKTQKQAMRYFRPFQIVRKIGTMAYQLDLVHKAWIHPIFHVSLLKECEGDPLLGNYYSITTHHHWIRTIVVTSSNPLEAYCFKRHHPVQQALNQWEGLSTTGNSWEDVEQLQHSFQQLNLEDKITINGRGNVYDGECFGTKGS